MEDPNAEWGNEYSEFAIAIDNGGRKFLFGPFSSLLYAQESLAEMKTWDEYKNKKLYIMKRTVSPWKPY